LSERHQEKNLYHTSGMKFKKLLKTARAISPEVDIHFRATMDPNEWVCAMYFGKDVILFESVPGKLDIVVDAALDKLKGMSQQMQAVIIAVPDDPPED